MVTGKSNELFFVRPCLYSNINRNKHGRSLKTFSRNDIIWAPTSFQVKGIHNCLLMYLKTLDVLGKLSIGFSVFLASSLLSLVI